MTIIKTIYQQIIQLVHFSHSPLPLSRLAVSPVCLPVRLLAPLAKVPRPHAAAALQQLLLGVAVPADSVSSSSARCCCGSVYVCDLL